MANSIFLSNEGTRILKDATASDGFDGNIWRIEFGSKPTTTTTANIDIFVLSCACEVQLVAKPNSIALANDVTAG